MIREVDLASYLPGFMQSYKEPAAALEAENPEFAVIWDATNKVLYNHFISTADEYGISRFETILGIYPSEEDTVESRRSRIQSKWFDKIPYTWRVLLQKLTVLCGDSDFLLTHNFAEGYTLTIQTGLELYGQVEELENIINSIIPCNIIVHSKNRVVYDACGTAFFGGGLVFMNWFTITNDFKQTLAAQSKAAFGGGIVQTAILQIGQDFGEVLRAQGNHMEAFHDVVVDFVDIKKKTKGE